MPAPTDEEIARALEEVAEPLGDGKWLWAGILHTDEEARAIVRADLILDQPVSDILTGQTFAAVVDRLLLAEERVARLEEHVPRGAR